MKKTTIWVILAIILVVIIAGMLMLRAKTAEAPMTNTQEEVQNASKTIDVKHQYKNGEHIFSGLVEAPTPCHQITAQIFPGEVAELNIEIKDSGKICAQVISNIPFKVSYKAPEDQQFLAKLNGEPVNLNRFEVDADLNIDEVELFIKG